jgi:hypothetical protein
MDGEEAWLDDAISSGRLPKSVRDNLAEARNRPRASGPTATKQGFNEVLAVDLADGTTISSSSSETITVPDYTFAANDPHVYPGAVFRITQYWEASFPITTPGTLIMRLRWGGSAGTLLANSGTYAPDPTSAQSNRSGFVEYMTVVRSIGVSGSMFTMGRMFLNDIDDATVTTIQGNLNMSVIPVSAPAVVGSLDTTTTKGLSSTAQFNLTTQTFINHLRVLECLN